MRFCSGDATTIGSQQARTSSQATTSATSCARAFSRKPSTTSSTIGAHVAAARGRAAVSRLKSSSMSIMLASRRAERSMRSAARRTPASTSERSITCVPLKMGTSGLRRSCATRPANASRSALTRSRFCMLCCSLAHSRSSRRRAHKSSTVQAAAMSPMSASSSQRRRCCDGGDALRARAAPLAAALRLARSTSVTSSTASSISRASISAPRGLAAATRSS